MFFFSSIPPHHIITHLHKRFYNLLTSSASYTPKPPPRTPLPYFSYAKIKGEDAYYTGKKGCAIADGVGGWQNHTVKLVAGGMVQGVAEMIENDPTNAATEKEEAMEEATSGMGMRIQHKQKESDAIHKRNDIIDQKREMIRMIHKAHLQIPRHNIGTCTLCVAKIDERNLLVANIGDSGARVYRKQPPEQTSGISKEASNASFIDMICKTKEMTYSFNFPKQIGTDSETTARDAELYQIGVKENDLVLLASDGLFDNVYDSQLIEMIDKWSNGSADWSIIPLQPLADSIVAFAAKIGAHRTIRTPFSDNAMSAGYQYKGGKEDDIAVVLGVVVNEEP